AQGAAPHHGDQAVVAGGQRHGGDLGLVTHFRQEEQRNGGRQHAQAAHWRRRFVELVGDQQPAGHEQEGNPQQPLQDGGIEQPGDQLAGQTGQGMVGQGGNQHAQADQDGTVVTGGQHHGQQLGLVADFTQSDHTGGNEE